jgi:ATP-dependent helicase HrpA
VELAIQKDLAWLEKDLRGLSRFDSLYAPLGGGDELRAGSLEHLKRYLLPAEPLPSLTRKDFEAALAVARERLPGLAQRFMDRLEPILQLWRQAQQRVGTAAAAAMPRPQTLSSFSQIGAPAVRAKNPLADELTHLIHPRFLERIPYERLPHLPRYLKALLIRAERAAFNPAKHEARSRQLAPYLEALKELEAQPRRTPEAQRQLDAYRWMVEEFKVSLFAQELGTDGPVSPQRLDRQLEAARRGVSLQSPA